eukprot:1159183-Pelagomonas_calceolata.AAC.34
MHTSSSSDRKLSSSGYTLPRSQCTLSSHCKAHRATQKAMGWQPVPHPSCLTARNVCSKQV